VLEARRQEQEKQMPFVTFPERYGREQGKEEGLLKGLEVVLRMKFGPQGTDLLPALRQLQDSGRLETILQALEQAASLDDARKLLPTGDGTPSAG
jgi:hypothetical protein